MILFVIEKFATIEADVCKIFVVAAVLDVICQLIFFAGSILAKRCWSRPS